MDIPSYLLGKKAGGGGGSNFQSKSIEITENGTTNVKPDTGYDALKNVNVTVTGILDTSDANAVSSDIAISKTAYVNGNKVTGNVPVGSSSTPTNYSANNVNINSNNLQVDTEQENGNQMFRTGDKISVYASLTDVASVVGATANKIKKDEVICGVTGTYEGGRDWSEIGYSSEPISIDNTFNIAKRIKENWDSTSTSISTFFKAKPEITFPASIDTKNVINFASMFEDCFALQEMPLYDTSNGTNFNKMFRNCYSLKSIPTIDTSNGTNFSNMFYGCNSLEVFPAIDTSNGTDFRDMFYQLSAIIENIPELDLSNANNINNIINVSYITSKIINFGGFKNLGKAYLSTASANVLMYTLKISKFKSNHDSLMNIINKLYDIATAGVQTQSLQLGSTNLAELTAEEVAVATNKGWSVS